MTNPTQNIDRGVYQMTHQIQWFSYYRKALKKAAALFSCIMAVAIIGGCAAAPETLTIKDKKMDYKAGDIIKADSGETISFDTLMADLESIRVVYVGERHTNPDHHRIQSEIITALSAKNKNISIGMEMFDHTYQPILDHWSTGEIDRDQLLRQTHWYANWRYDFDFYKEILETARKNHIQVVGLNIPFHIPPKISIGGIESLGAMERNLLPKTVDTSIKEHRSYIEKIYKFHRIKGRDKFEYFYEAQCVWEDAMASQIAKHLGQNQMVVIAGNGHIIHKFGIPDRAYARTGAPFKTIYLAAEGSEAELEWADYIWVTQSNPHKIGAMRMKKN